MSYEILKEKVKMNKRDILMFLIILIIVFFQIFRCIDLPGLYFDAVNPDYLAVQMLFPDNGIGTKYSQTGFPFLAQLYHGTLISWIQLLVIGIMGRTSLVTVRIANAIYVIAICWMIYLILKSMFKDKIINYIMVMALALSPQVFSYMRTQYHLKLPGTLLILMSIYFLCISPKMRGGQKIVLSGLLAGVAFYSYFIYLFFVPAMMIICVYYAWIEKRGMAKDFFTWIVGFGVGSLFYVAGYSDLLITALNISKELKKDIIFIFEIVLLLAGVLLIKMVIRAYSDNKLFKKLLKALFCFLGIIMLALITCSKTIITILEPLIKSTNVLGRPMGLAERISGVLVTAWSVIKNRNCEWLMIGKTVSFFTDIYVYLFVLLSIIIFLIFLLKKSSRRGFSKIFIFWGMLFSYFVVALIFVPRMGGQHFTPVFFLSYLVICIEINMINTYITIKSVRQVLCVIAGALLLLGWINSNLICTNLKIVKGNGLYTHHINDLANKALVERENGIKTLYVFPESGIGSNFIYLTMNQIASKGGVHADVFREYLEGGYRIEIYYWDINNMEKYEQALFEAGVNRIEEKTFFTGEGEPVLYGLFSNDDSP